MNRPGLTRPQIRLLVAARRLDEASHPGQFRLSNWLDVRDLPRLPWELTKAQANLARRELNAWLAGLRGLSEVRDYPRKERRNMAAIRRRRQRAANEARNALAVRRLVGQQR